MTRQQRYTEYLIRLVLLATLIALGLGLVCEARGAERRCETRVCLKRALDWNVQQRRMLEKRLAIKLRPSVDYACRLGEAAFGVPTTHCKKVVGCESGGRADLNEYGGSNGARGIAQYQPRTWSGTAFARVGFSIWDPIAQILAMDAYAARSGFNTGGGWAASYRCHRLSGAEGR